MVLQIGKKKYKVLFGYGALRILARKFKLKKLSELDKVFSKLNFKDNEEPSLEQMDVLVDLVMAGLQNADEKITLSASEVADEIFIRNPDKLQKVIQLFSESMPKSQGK